MKVVGLVLAAGRGSRFIGQDKLLARLHDDACVAEAAARTAVAALDCVVALVAREDLARARTLREAGCEVHVCAHASGGMGRVLADGIAHAGDADAWIVLLADMPFIRVDTIRAVADALTTRECAAPWFEQRRGHPVGFTRTHRDALLALDGDHGARALLQRIDVHRIDTDDEGVLIDIDTRDDLMRHRLRASGRGS